MNRHGAIITARLSPRAATTAISIAMAKQALAILQERFVKLQRARERREEKEHRKHFAGPDPSRLYLMFPDGSVRPKQAESSVQHQVNCHQYLARQQRKSPEGCFLSLGSRSECNQGGFGGVVGLRAVTPANKRPYRMTGRPGMSRAPDYADVDTCLHL